MKQNLRYYCLAITILFTSLILAQDYTDYLIDKNNTKIFCKITQIKNGKVKYRLQGKSYSTIKTLVKFSDVSFANPDVLKNPLGLKIETPETGYAHVYFYYSGIIYKVRHNGQKLTNIGVGSYYLHKIKVGESHNYSCYGNSLEIAAEDQKTYLVRATDSVSDYEAVPTFDSVGKTTNDASSGLQMVAKLVLDNRKVSEYALLSMKKKAK